MCAATHYEKILYVFANARNVLNSSAIVKSHNKGVDMNWDIVEGNWKQFKGKVQARWGKLTNDQLDKIAGARVELAGAIQESYGLSEDLAEEQIKGFELQNRYFKPNQSKHI